MRLFPLQQCIPFGRSLFLVCSLSLGCTVQAESDRVRFVKELPSPDKLCQAAETSDQVETWARQLVLTEYAGNLVRDLEADCDPAELAAIQERRYAYFQQSILYNEKMCKAYGMPADAQGANKRKWDAYMSLRSKYGEDYGLLRDVLIPMLTSSAARKRVNEWIATNGTPAQRKATEDAAVAKDVAEWQARKASEQPTDPMAEFQHILELASQLILAIVALCALLVALGLWRELRPHGLDPNDSTCYRVGWRKFKLYQCTGVALGCETQVTTHRTQNTDQYGRITNYVSTSVQKEFHIREADGMEHAMSSVSANVHVRNGNVMSALWAIRKGRQRGPYVLFYNHDLRESSWAHAGTRELTRSRRLAFIPLAIGTYIFCNYWTVKMMAENMAPIRFDQGQMPITEPELAMVMVFIPYIAPFLAILVYWIITRAIASGRRSRLTKVIGPQWIAGFKERAEKELKDAGMSGADWSIAPA